METVTISKKEYDMLLQKLSLRLFNTMESMDQ